MGMQTDGRGDTNERILFVDDEEHVLDSMRRQLRKRFAVETAASGKEALEKFKNGGPFAVVVSDMRMPEMDGVQLLTAIRDMYPDTVRLMLTGNADQETAIEAVNKGQIFRFLNKPCPAPVLITSLALALRQYRLLIAEKELLDKTLKSSVKILAELLSFTSPVAMSSGARMRGVVLKIAEAMGLEMLWQVEVAALMSQIGCVTLPADILDKVLGQGELDAEEREMYLSHPERGASLLENIPRLEGVASIVKNQMKRFDEYPPAGDQGFDEPELAAQIIKAVFDHHQLRLQGLDHSEAMHKLRSRREWYNPVVLEKLGKTKAMEDGSELLTLRIQELTVGMRVEVDIMAKNGTLLAPKGQEITLPVLQGLQNFARKVGVREPVHVRRLAAG